MRTLFVRALHILLLPSPCRCRSLANQKNTILFPPRCHNCQSMGSAEDLSSCVLILLALTISLPVIFGRLLLFIFAVIGLVKEGDDLSECGDSALWVFVLVHVILNGPGLCSRNSKEEDQDKSCGPLFCMLIVVSGLGIWGVVTIASVSSCVDTSSMVFVTACIYCAIEMLPIALLSLVPVFMILVVMWGCCMDLISTPRSPPLQAAQKATNSTSSSSSSCNDVEEGIVHAAGC